MSSTAIELGTSTAAIELDVDAQKPRSSAVLFEWDGVSVQLPGADGKVLLAPHSGQLDAGELVCILGPSGAGKTTLLSAIFGDKDLAQGSVHLAGEPLFASHRRSSRRRHIAADLGYVRQKDIFIEELTVRETLTFTARLRMPEASQAQIEERVAAVVKDMGLENTLGTTIGSTMKRGISGGELKRVNIATELLGMPKVLLLDEPTSGLDSTYALQVVSKLRAYVRSNGVGCLCTLHQPSERIVALLDRIVLMLPGGGIAFSGTPTALAAHLGSLGLPTPNDSSLLDHSMSLLCDEAHAPTLQAAWAAGKAAGKAADTAADTAAEAAPQQTMSVAVASGTPRRARLSFGRTVCVLARRQTKQSRSKLLKFDEVALNILIGTTTGLIWWQSAGTPDERGALFFFAAHMTWWPGFLYLFSFPSEVAVLTKELLSDTYSIESYLVSKLLADTPSEIVCPSVFFASALPMIGFGPAASVLIWLTMLLHFQTSASFGMLCSVLSDHPRCPFGPNTLISALFVLQMCAGGFLRDPRTYPAGLQWLSYTSVFYYSSSIISQVASPTGTADPQYSPLGLAANLVVLAAIAVGLKLCLYAALKLRDLKFE